MQVASPETVSHNLKNKTSVIDEEETFPKSVLDSVEKIAKQEGFKKHNVLKKQFSTNGGSYLATLYEVNITGETDAGSKETNLFIKHVIPESPPFVLSVSKAYYRESLFYNELSKILETLQDDANIPKTERINFAKSYSETNTEDIILDNLVKKGFHTMHRMDVVSLNYAEIAVEKLAKFHGINYILKKKRPDYFNEKIKPMEYSFECNDDWETFIKHQTTLSTEKLEDKYKQRVKDYLPTFFKNYRAIVEPTSAPEFTLCHGDWRPNNILTLDVDGEVTEMVPVDFQMIFYGCPLTDFFFFIYLCTDSEFRRNHLTYLKDHYFSSLERYISYFGEDINDFFPRKVFEKQFAEKIEWGLMIALFGLPFLFTSETEVPVIGEHDFLNLPFVIDERGFVRMKEVLDEFIDLGFL